MGNQLIPIRAYPWEKPGEFSNPHSQPAPARRYSLTLRVALFSDSFAEANGVATLSREFAAYTLRHDIPFCAVHSGPHTQLIRDRSLTTLELRRGPASFPVDHDLYCDPLLSRHKSWVLEHVRAFQPDLVHITGPGDMGIMGLWIAHLLRVPLVASWHTNLHEYAGRRLERGLAFLPRSLRGNLARTAESRSLDACMWFYRYARFHLSPNEGMAAMLSQRTGRPSFLMAHGVDTHLFSPGRCTPGSRPFTIGYVGRLTPEKNVRLFAELEQSLHAAGRHDFRIVMVGEGSERDWLRKHVRSAELPGILRGPDLASAFADMDVFVFPSQTDTFGLVLLEAMASGVPVIVSPEAAQRIHLADGTAGFLAPDLAAFTHAVLQLMDGNSRRFEMSIAARQFACSHRWTEVFHRLFATYAEGLEQIGWAARPLHESPREAVRTA